MPPVSCCTLDMAVAARIRWAAAPAALLIDLFAPWFLAPSPRAGASPAAVSAPA